MHTHAQTDTCMQTDRQTDTHIQRASTYLEPQYKLHLLRNPDQKKIQKERKEKKSFTHFKENETEAHQHLV